MLNQLSERIVHRIRWGLAIAWLLLIASLFYDPITPYLTQPSATFSPFRVDPQAALNVAQCVQVQGVCLLEQPYSLSARIFWAMVVPAGLFIIFVLGHEVWRRICPLAFFSQIPRRLGIQRKRKRVSSNGKTRYELVSIEQKSWLGRNFLLLQFGLLFFGLVARILFINSDRWALGGFLIVTILASILVGYLYAGKSWCQYFCPMAPVEMIFTGPRGLLGSQAHLNAQRGLTQSMCREVDLTTGQEKSACVGCQSPCIDIDAERSHWDRISQRDRKFVQYGYIGLVFAFYFYFFLYAGNWDYYYSGAWTHEEDQLKTLWSSGFYLWGYPIPIPKLIAVPLTFAVFVGASYWLINLAEKAYRTYLQRQGRTLDNAQILHRIFTICTFGVWNLFWIFGSRPTINLLPLWQQNVFSGLIVFVSSIWFYRTFWRTTEQYSREGLANTLRRQLDKQGFDLTKILNRSSSELKPDEVYVLAKVLPNVSQSQKLEVYKGVVQAALTNGIVSSTESALLQELQTGFGISQNEHYSILASLGIEDPTLFDSMHSTSLETQLRLDGYRQSLEALLRDLVDYGTPMNEALVYKRDRIMVIRQEYRITDEENDQILSRIWGQSGEIFNQAENLLRKFEGMSVQVQVLQTQPPNPDQPVYKLLRSTINHRQMMILRRLLSLLEILGVSADAYTLVQRIKAVTYELLPTVLTSTSDDERDWQKHLMPEIFSLLVEPVDADVLATSIEYSNVDLSNVLQTILNEDLEPLMRALSLCALHQVNPLMAGQAVTKLLQIPQPQFVEETAQAIQRSQQVDFKQSGERLTMLDKLFCLSESQFFSQLPLTILMDVALSCQFRSYRLGEVICQVGDRSQEIFIVFSGKANVQILRADQSTQVINTVSLGETIGELGVLTKAPRSATVIAASETTTVLMLEAQRLETLLQKSPALAIGLLAIISKRLQNLTKYAESALRSDTK